MTPLEAARALAEMYPITEVGDWRHHDSTPCYGDPDCPHMALPQIVAALEAAERLRRIDGVSEDEEPTARDLWADEYIYWFCNGYAPDHEDGCPWQSFAAALKGDAG